MISSNITFRVRYAETDKMGYVYYGNYATYLEVARVEFFRNLGISYKELEDNNILLPVSHLEIKYLRPLFYDETFTVTIVLREIPTGTKIIFGYEIFNADKILCTHAETTLYFFDKISQKPIACPDYIQKILEVKSI